MFIFFAAVVVDCPWPFVLFLHLCFLGGHFVHASVVLFDGCWSFVHLLFLVLLFVVLVLLSVVLVLLFCRFGVVFCRFGVAFCRFGVAFCRWGRPFISWIFMWDGS